MPAFLNKEKQLGISMGMRMGRIIARVFFLITITTMLVAAALSAGAQTNPTLTWGDSEVPLILPRAFWDNTSSLNALLTWLPQNTDFPSDWQPVERIILHDTGCDSGENPNCNHNQDPVPTIQGIYRFHSVTRGWGDIGYNYIVDQQGRIYEGRYGGNGSRGAHVFRSRTKDNFNYGSIGITILGNYGTVEPPAAVYESLARLVGWLAAANNLDPPGSRSSLIWNTDGFKTLFSGPIVIGHKHAEPSNPDPGKLDFERLRREAAVFVPKYKSYLYQVAGSDKVYKIENGTRRVFANLADFLTKGGSYSRLVSVSQSQLDLFSETRFLKYPDGSLLKVIGQPSVYLIEDGQKRHLAVSAKEFGKLGFDFDRVRSVTADELGVYPEGLSLNYGPDKQLLMSEGAKVYLIENGKKRWIPSVNLFAVLGLKWSKVKQNSQLAYFLDGHFLTYPDGSLLRPAGQPTVYLIQNGQKHEFISSQSFLKAGYGWEKVKTVEPGELALYPSGHFVTYPDGALLKAANSPNVFLTDQGKIRAFLSAEIFLNLKYQWSQILTIPAAELAYYSQGEPVKYRQGTLLRAKNSPSVYLVSGGKLAAVDAATFKKKKYKWSQVLVISDSDFNNLYGPNPITSLAPLAAPTVPSAAAIASATARPAAEVVQLAVQPKIRIALFEVATSSLSFSANSAYDIFDKTGQVLNTKKAGERFDYVLSVALVGTFIKIVPQAVDGAVEIASFEDHPAWRPSLNYNQFRGSIEIVYSAKSDKVWAVNELSLEDYLKGVAESSQGDQTEYQKAMSVAARTYAYYYLQKGGKHSSQEVYHLTNKTSDQLYKGYGREVLAPSWQAAAEATRGQVVFYKDAPIVAAYSSGAPEFKSSGSRSACSVWGGQFCQVGFEYLTGGVKDPEGADYQYVTCAGPNHCVGLSGAGTRQFAKTGAKNWQEILRYYYPGAEVKTIY